MSIGRRVRHLVLALVLVGGLLAMAGPAFAEDVHTPLPDHPDDLSVYNYAIQYAIQTAPDEVAVRMQIMFCGGCYSNPQSHPGCTPFEHEGSVGYRACSSGYPDGTYAAVRLKDMSGHILGMQKLVCNPSNWPLGVTSARDFLFQGLALAPGQMVVVEAEAYCSWCGHWYAEPRGILIQGSNTAVDYTGPANGVQGTTVAFEGSLVDANGMPLAGRTLAFTLDGLAPVSAVTDSNGVAHVGIAIPSDLAAGTYPMTVRFAGAGAYFPSSKTGTLIVETPNSPPLLDADASSVTVSEGSDAQMTGSVSDPDGDPLDVTASSGTVVVSGSNWTWTAPEVDGPSGESVTIIADDGEAVSAVSFDVLVENVAPTVTSFTGPVAPLALGAPCSVKLGFEDCGSLDTHAVSYDWGDGSSSAGDVTEAGGCGAAEGTHTYASPGVYLVKGAVVDCDGGTCGATYEQYVVVFSPDGGFVTGGGWFNSPEGAYAENLSAAGKATFGFVSKYQKGATIPTGNTQFQLHTASFSFKSTSYDFLVVAGAKALYQGAGTINGAGDYAFKLYAIDGQANGGGGADKFRIRIWDKSTQSVIYDNQIGDDFTADASTQLGGGSITIHK